MDKEYDILFTADYVEDRYNPNIRTNIYRIRRNVDGVTNGLDSMALSEGLPYHLPQLVLNADGYNWDGYFVEAKDLECLDHTLNVYLEQGDWNSLKIGEHMFYGTNIKKLHYITNLKDLSYIFHNCYYLEDVDYLGQMDLSNVYDASSMFFSCYNLKTVPDLNLSSCTEFSGMFLGCSGLESIGVIDMGGITYEDFIPSGNAVAMFSGCTNLKHIGGLKNADISIGLSDCINLTRESMLNIFNSVSSISNNDEKDVTLSIDYTVYGQLSDDDIAILTNKHWFLSVTNNEGPHPDMGGEI